MTYKAITNILCNASNLLHIIGAKQNVFHAFRDVFLFHIFKTGVLDSYLLHGMGGHIPDGRKIFFPLVRKSS